MREKHTSTGYPAAMHPKHSKLSIVNIPKDPVIVFSCHKLGRYISTRKNFAYLGSFAKAVYL